MTTTQMPSDPHSYAIPSESVISHLDWDANVSFQTKTIEASATYILKNSSEAQKIILDTKNLTIFSVTDNEGHVLPYELGDEQVHLGQALTIKITPSTASIKIHYKTSPDAEALQWLSPKQTANKTSPFLFTQSQAILARTWIPIQDSPGIRFTYSAKVQVPQELLALMSASNPTEKNDSGLYLFEMQQAIPAYLMALTVGDVSYASLGKRSGVYAEPSLLAKSAYEFENLEQMIQAAETLYGPYRWERYDVIVLPPSFPFGGMENPRLTFATPTIIAGDRSLISLVAHELAHSWSGNLVTNATWNDFWLNEGFTVYFENRIMEALYGREYAEMLALLSLQDLQEEVKEINDIHPADTHLKLDLTGRNPDDGVTAIAYDKGYYLLRMLEETVGREVWDDFVRKYFDEHAFQGMTTEEFILILQKDLLDAHHIDMSPSLYKEWIYKSGLPSNCPQPVSNKFIRVEQAIDNWVDNQNPQILREEYDAEQWSTHEWLHFIRTLPTPYPAAKMAVLDQAFGLTQSGNSEIFAVWGVLVIANQYKTAYPELQEFLIHTGRRKFLMPLYKEMIKTAEGKRRAQEIYTLARPNYHSVAYNSLDPLLQ
ncbi:aminopeptidase [Reichenbachiella sp. 5M10]|uniref:M1 family metallopeptidase n=1 Tax=Reichenbachiella sp. 5M10 TaxID=1889772 RepID=UPI000C460444|nr:M1 family metallopeptidase [Reichenbachiella sp. 5M10]PIB37563.1 aminopeptidase [Reichenbachiella sp. 5M10]